LICQGFLVHIHRSELQEQPQGSCEVFAHPEGRRWTVTACAAPDLYCWRLKIGRNLERDGWVVQSTNALAA
jgi:hypothetical protein